MGSKLKINKENLLYFMNVRKLTPKHMQNVYAGDIAQLLEKDTLIEEEKIEKLEQLRWIQNDIEISMAEVSFDGIEINTSYDYLLWKHNNGMKDGDK